MKRIAITSILLILATICIQAKIVKGFSCSSDNKLTFTVDSIDYRQDLTRVYGKFEGRPHTSARVDEVSITGPSIAHSATDIDGVDFRRYFQWEDDGIIPIEIDFPKMEQVDEMQILFMTVNGPTTTTVKKNHKSNK